MNAHAEARGGIWLSVKKLNRISQANAPRSENCRAALSRRELLKWP